MALGLRSAGASSCSAGSVSSRPVSQGLARCAVTLSRVLSEEGPGGPRDGGEGGGGAALGVTHARRWPVLLRQPDCRKPLTQPPEPSRSESDNTEAGLGRLRISWSPSRSLVKRLGAWAAMALP